MTSHGSSLTPNPSVGETRNQLSSLASQMRAEEGSADFVLVVGHSNTVPEIINGLGVGATVVVGEENYDNLFCGCDAAQCCAHGGES